MTYSIEIYLGEDDSPQYSDEGPAMFPKPSIGDLIRPMWRDGEHFPGDRYRVVRVEHIIWEQGHKLMVYCESAAGSR